MKRVSAGPTLAKCSATRASPVASVGPLTRVLERRIPQCDDSNGIRRGEVCSVRRKVLSGWSIRKWGSPERCLAASSRQGASDRPNPVCGSRLSPRYQSWPTACVFFAFRRAELNKTQVRTNISRLLLT